MPHCILTRWRDWLLGMHVRAITFAGSSALKQVLCVFPPHLGAHASSVPFSFSPFPGAGNPQDADATAHHLGVILKCFNTLLVSVACKTGLKMRDR